MPAYFTLTMQFEKKRIHPDFVKEVYSQMISCGFDFKSGYMIHENASLDEIIDWNQKRIDVGFVLGYTQHYKHDYMQILFQTEYYSELRGYWMYFDEVAFNLIIPEGSIMTSEGSDCFVEEKIIPVKKLAIKMWEAGIVDAIQTSVELSDGCYSLSSVLSGNGISIIPFAILPENAFACFPDNYFKNKEIVSSRIGKHGVFLEPKLQSGDCAEYRYVPSSL